MTDHDHDHDRTAAPMVDEITDFEVLEIAVRELCIEKGLFTAEDHRRLTEHFHPYPARRDALPRYRIVPCNSEQLYVTVRKRALPGNGERRTAVPACDS